MTTNSQPLTPVAQSLWQVSAPTQRFDGGLRLPLSASLVRLADSSLLLYSPAPLSAAQVAAIAELGEVTHLVAPNLLHHLFVKQTTERYPQATLTGAPGLARKRSDLQLSRELSSATQPFGAELEVLVVAGAPALNEVVLFHHPTGTLLCADLLFHVANPEGLWSRLLLSAVGANGKLAQSRVWQVAVKDRPAYRASLERLLRWDVQRVLPTHGAPAALEREQLARLLARAAGGPLPLG
ncbi:MAG: DUF4336 domain-containing protein [Polyangiaceae bacterium]|nr:DUF4336 domain-containing protein [Polyangiaceae bacterium]MCW5789645.1 DUF4336 domain-containing protein [Polyangiaceae bacterium]